MKSPIDEIFKSLDSLKEELNEQNKVNVKKRNLEKVKRFLLEKELLLEKDNREIIVNKMGLSQEIADYAHNMSDKYSLWIANQIKEFIEDDSTFNRFKLIHEHMLPNIISMFKDDNRPKIDIKNINFRDAEQLTNLYGYVKDWRDNPNTPTLNLRNMSWQEAERLANEWHESLKASGKVSYILDDKDEIIHEFNDGFYWVLRKDYRCEKSAESMGHCATASRNDMYLFRLIKDDEEFITADYDPNDKYIIQLKGKKNTKPKDVYYTYIMWLIAESGYIEELRTNQGYRVETNFQLEDLNNEQLKYVLLHNHNIIFNANNNLMLNYNILLNFVLKDKDLFKIYNKMVKEFYRKEKFLPAEYYKFLTYEENIKLILSPKGRIHLNNFIHNGLDNNNKYTNNDDVNIDKQPLKNIKKLFDLGFNEEIIFDSFSLYEFEKPENIFKLFKGKTLKNYLTLLYNDRRKQNIEIPWLFGSSESPIKLLNFLIKNIGEEKAYELIDGIFDSKTDIFENPKNPQELYQIQKIQSDRKNSNQTPMNEIFKSLTSLKEELTEQRKETIKESNLMKVQNFIKNRKNNQ
jgi:hypothetical protein